MVVIDTSVVYKWFAHDEPLRSEAKEILGKHLSGQEKIVTLDLLLYEISNAWATKTRLTKQHITKSVHLLERYGLEIEAVSFALLKKAIILSKTHKVSVYDASYMVLAQEKKCDLVTADSEFVKRVHRPYVKHLERYSV